MRKLRIKITTWALKFLHILVANRVIKIYGLKLKICKNVFSPLYTISSRLLVHVAMAEIKKQDIVLDLGTGSGIISLVIANKVHYTIASDISLFAAYCALENLKRNNLHVFCDVVICDLMQSFRKRAFSLIIFNPPYINGKAKTQLEKSWFGNIDLMRRFLGEAKKVLKEKGRMIITYSDLGPLRDMLKFTINTGWKISRVKHKRFLGENVYVFKLV